MTNEEAIEKLNMLDEALNFQRHDADECSQALQMAIRSLKAWEEVLQEFEGHRRNGNNLIGLNDAISIINQHLAEIE